MRTHLLIAGLTLSGLLGCSNPRVESTQIVLPVVTLPPAPGFQLPASDVELLARQLHAHAQAARPPSWQGEEFKGRICQVAGSTCLEMDDRPFEPCLLSSQDCSKKLQESLRRGEGFGPSRRDPAR